MFQEYYKVSKNNNILSQNTYDINYQLENLLQQKNPNEDIFIKELEKNAKYMKKIILDPLENKKNITFKNVKKDDNLLILHKKKDLNEKLEESYKFYKKKESKEIDFLNSQKIFFFLKICLYIYSKKVL